MGGFIEINDILVDQEFCFRLIAVKTATATHPLREHKPPSEPKSPFNLKAVEISSMQSNRLAASTRLNKVPPTLVPPRHNPGTDNHFLI